MKRRALASAVLALARRSRSPSPAARRPSPSRSASAARPGASPSRRRPRAALPPELKGPEYTENDFVESDRNRDPFRSFLVAAAAGEPGGAQPAQGGARPVLDRRAEAHRHRPGLRPAARDVPRPSGKGTVVYKGTFMCRPEVVHIGGVLRGLG